MLLGYTMSTTTDYPRRSPRLHPPAPARGEVKTSRPRDEDEDDRDRDRDQQLPPAGYYSQHPIQSHHPYQHDLHHPLSHHPPPSSNQHLPLPPVHLIDLIFLVMVVMCVGLVAYCFGQISSDWWGKPLFVSIIGLLAGIALVYDSFILAGVAARRYS